MCGIAGSTEDPRGDAVVAMTGAMVHRGPDDDGLVVDPSTGVALGARRLSIVDVAGGHQPVQNEDGSISAVLNGEIYNHPRLRDQLRKAGHRFASNTDTEVLVHLYEDYGEAMVHALEGMYAFAIWDRNTRRLLLGRDRFGEKPLFYTTQGDQLVFASELNALRRGVERAPGLDAAAFDLFFVLGYFPGETTAFSGFHQLPPATVLLWSPDQPVPRLESYWAMPALAGARADRLSRIAEEGEELLRDSVRSRLIADVGVGVFLSGGLDSTLVATLAANEISGTLKTFTVGYEARESGEIDHARRVAARLGSDHHECIIAVAEVRQRTEDVLGSLDQPNADPALLALHALAELARPRVTVAVGGEGADELFGGYPRYRWIARAAIAERYLPARLSEVGMGWFQRAPGGRTHRMADVLKRTSMAERNLDWVTSGRRHLRQQFYGERMRACLAVDRALDDSRAVLSMNGADGVVGQAMRLDQRRYLPDDVLAKADRATMLTSLEMRTPYLSRELAEFAASIPPKLHVSRGGKAVLREIAQGMSVSLAANRGKRAFLVPTAEWLRGPLHELLAEQVNDGALVNEGWIDRGTLRAAVDEHRAGGVDRTGVLWPVLAAGLWLDRLGLT